MGCLHFDCKCNDNISASPIRKCDVYSVFGLQFAEKIKQKHIHLKLNWNNKKKLCANTAIIYNLIVWIGVDVNCLGFGHQIQPNLALLIIHRWCFTDTNWFAVEIIYLLLILDKKKILTKTNPVYFKIPFGILSVNSLASIFGFGCFLIGTSNSMGRDSLLEILRKV